MMRSGLFSLLIGTSLAIGFPGATRVAQADEEVLLETMTVIGTRTEKRQFDNPRSVSVLTQKDMQKSSLEGLTEMLRDVPGVQILDAGVPGMKRVEIRGESSRRNVILIDGQEITDHSSYGTPLLIDASSVERIEVLKGPSSVLYGSKAIGGVVNVITKTGGNRGIEGDMVATYFSATDGYDVNGSFRGAIGAWDYRISGGKADHGDRETPEGRLDPSAYDHDSISGHLGFNAGRHYVAVKADQYRMSSEAWVDPDSFAPPLVGFDLDLPKRDRQKIGIFYEGSDLTPWLSQLQADAYHQTVDREINQALTFAFGGPSGMLSDNSSEDQLTTSGGTIQLDIRPHSDHLLIVGGQYLDDNLDAVKISTTTILPFPGIPFAIITEDDASIRTASIYVQDDWSLSDDVSLLLGIRYYDVSAKLNESNHSPLSENDDQKAVGSVGLTYAGFRDHLLRIQFDQGYVYPSLLQLFVDSPFSGGAITFGNPDLDPETSDSIEFGWRHQTGRMSLDGSIFYTESEDYITRVLIDDGPSDIWENIEQARSYGAELFLEYNTEVAGNMRPYLNGTWLRRRYETQTYSTYDTLTPEFTARLGLRFDLPMNGWLDLFVRGATDATLKDETGVVEESDGWSTLNLWLGMNLGRRENLALTLHLNNLADAEYQPTNELPGPGLSADLSMRFSF